GLGAGDMEGDRERNFDRGLPHGQRPGASPAAGRFVAAASFEDRPFFAGETLRTVTIGSNFAPLPGSRGCASSRNRGGIGFSEAIECVRGGDVGLPGLLGTPGGFEGEAEMKEGEGMALGEAVDFADRDRLTKGRGARFEMLARPRGIELRQAAQYN